MSVRKDWRKPVIKLQTTTTTGTKKVAAKSKGCSSCAKRRKNK